LRRSFLISVSWWSTWLSRAARRIHLKIMTKSPSLTLTAFTTPALSAAMGISIFIDSRISTSCPSATLSPGCTRIFHTVPAMFALIISAAPPASF
jgi:hypothetical protein